MLRLSLPKNNIRSSRINCSKNTSTSQKRGLFQEIITPKIHQNPIPEGPIKKSLDSIVPQLTAHHMMENRDLGVVSIPETNTVFEALKKMHDHDLGCIIVERVSGGFGIFTETDYVRKIAIRGLSSKTTELIQVTNYNVVTVTPNTALDQISSLMMQDGIHHLPVVEITGEPNNRITRPIAVISSRDVTENFVKAAIEANIELEGTVQQAFDRLGRQSSGDIWLSEDYTVYDAIKKMTDTHIGALLVNNRNSFTGIFTERDYLNKIILKGRSSRQTKLSEVVTRNVQYIPAESSIMECLQTAVKGKFRHIPVVTQLGAEINEGDMVGMITINDIMAYLMLEVDLKRLKKTVPDLM